MAFLGLPSHVDHERAKQLLRKDTWGGMLSFGVVGGADAGSRVVDKMKLATNMANVGKFGVAPTQECVLFMYLYDRRCEDTRYQSCDYNPPAAHGCRASLCWRDT